MEIRETREYAAEVKFILAAELGAEVERWAARWLAPDPHGSQYQVSSLYFDTPDQRVFRREGSYGRAKYRIRRYGNAETVFLERKLRTSQAVVKRRSVVPVEDIALLEVPQLDREWRNGCWFQKRLQARELQPAWQISYLRSARERQTNLGPIRLTLDRNLAALPLDGIAFEAARQPVPLFANGEMILELKFRREMPELFRDLLREFGLKPQPVSKFRLAATALAADRQQEKASCA